MEETLQYSPENYITPTTYQERRDRLPKLANDLLDMAVLFGSTHKEALWRENNDFISTLGENAKLAFNPKISGWKPENAQIEAQAMAEAGTIVLRIENKELKGGSLGSITEVGFAVLSSVLRGQKVIVSIEDNLAKSISDADPSAQLQYIFLERMMRRLKRDHGDHILVHNGDDYAQLGNLINEGMQRQRDQALVPFSNQAWEDFSRERYKKIKNPFSVFVTGTGDSYHQRGVKEKIFSDFRAKLKEIFVQIVHKNEYREESAGACGEMWRQAWGDIERMEEVSDLALKAKQATDVLLITIFDKADSKAAASELPYLLLHALENRQAVAILLEELDPLDYLQVKYHDAIEILEDSSLIELADKGNPFCQASILERVARVSLSKIGQAQPEQIKDAYRLLRKIEKGEWEGEYDEIKGSLLGLDAKLFQKVDNAQKVRIIAQAHMDRLMQDERYKNLVFAYANDRETYQQQVKKAVRIQ